MGWKVGRGTLVFGGKRYKAGQTIPDSAVVRAFPDERDRTSRMATLGRLYGVEYVTPKRPTKKKSKSKED